MAAVPATYEAGDRVIVNQKFLGVVRFYGPTQFASGNWVGIELDEKLGKNDGSVSSVSYFTCPPQKGIFVRSTQIEHYDGTQPAGDKRRTARTKPSTTTATTRTSAAAAAAASADASSTSPSHIATVSLTPPADSNTTGAIAVPRSASSTASRVHLAPTDSMADLASPSGKSDASEVAARLAKKQEMRAQALQEHANRRKASRRVPSASPDSSEPAPSSPEPAAMTATLSENSASRNKPAETSVERIRGVGMPEEDELAALEAEMFAARCEELELTNNNLAIEIERYRECIRTMHLDHMKRVKNFEEQVAQQLSQQFLMKPRISHSRDSLAEGDEKLRAKLAIEQQKNADLLVTIQAFEDLRVLTEEAFEQQVSLDFEMERQQKQKTAEVSNLKSVISQLHETNAEAQIQITAIQQELRNCHLKIGAYENSGAADDVKGGGITFLSKLQADRVKGASHLNRAFKQCMPDVVKTSVDGIVAFASVMEAERKCISVGYYLSERVLQPSVVSELPEDAVRWWAMAQCATQKIRFSTNGIASSIRRKPEVFEQVCGSDAFLACSKNCADIDVIANPMALALDGGGVLQPKEDLTILQGLAAHFVALHRSVSPPDEVSLAQISALLRHASTIACWVGRITKSPNWQKLYDLSDAAFKNVQVALNNHGKTLVVVDKSSSWVRDFGSKVSLAEQKVSSGSGEQVPSNEIADNLTTLVGKVGGIITSARAFEAAQDAWQPVCEPVKANLSKLDDLTKAVDELKFARDDVGSKKENAEHEITALITDKENLEGKLGEFRIRAERSVLLEAEVKKLRGQASYYVSEQAKLQEEMQKQMGQRKEAVEKQDSLEKRLKIVQDEMDEKKRKAKLLMEGGASAQEVGALWRVCNKTCRELAHIHLATTRSLKESPLTTVPLTTSRAQAIGSKLLGELEDPKVQGLPSGIHEEVERDDDSNKENDVSSPVEDEVGAETVECLRQFREVSKALLLQKASTRLVDLAPKKASTAALAPVTAASTAKQTVAAKKGDEVNAGKANEEGDEEPVPGKKGADSEAKKEVVAEIGTPEAMAKIRLQVDTLQNRIAQLLKANPPKPTLARDEDVGQSELVSSVAKGSSPAAMIKIKRQKYTEHVPGVIRLQVTLEDMHSLHRSLIM
eukprot:GEMP01004440.1.p1 GENE.GEMP01004440.1~~GEMP01004440.1.p1  ORF type:complete len:1143 (+),score=373.19 GEMP01004440.1:96-3524(+)